MKYNPFDKEYHDITELDLSNLIQNSVSEGWYIEYKTSIPKSNQRIDNNKVAKSVAAFANTKGGWIFYGIKADDKNIATEICGIDLNEFENLPDQLSRIIASNITPKPIYHFKTVELSNQGHVLLIKVEESPIPPYITSQGIIYQRENNENNPIRDRYIIEKLAEKADNYYESIERFCKIDYRVSESQSKSKQAHLELFLFPLPYGSFRFEKFRSSKFFQRVSEIFSREENLVVGGIKYPVTISLDKGFKNIYSSQQSLIIRLLSGESIIYGRTTIELFANGNLKLLIPINEFPISKIPEQYQNSSLIKHLRDTYIDSNSNDFEQNIKMIDGKALMFALLVIIEKYRGILKEFSFDLNDSIGFRAKITDAWRKFIFFDHIQYLEKIKLFHLPIVLKDTIEIPKFAKGKHYKMNIKEDLAFFTVALQVLTSIGLPDSEDLKFDEIFMETLFGQNYKERRDNTF